MTTLPITGNVDPALLAGMAALRQSYDGLADATERTGQRAAAAERQWSSTVDTVRRGAQAFNETHQALQTILGTIGSAADEVVNLATEQSQLDATSRRLGINFDSMAAAAGRFTDETQAMAVATELAAHGVVMTQRQSEGLMAAIGAASIRQNISMREAADNATAAIIRGRERGLEPYGRAAAELAGSAHTANERMAAIASTGDTVARATDTAADQVERLRDNFDDSKRAVAAAFVHEFSVLQGLTREAGGAGGSVDDLGETFTTMGETVATTTMRAIVGVQMLGRAAQIVVGGLAAPINALARAGSIEGVGIGPARARLAALREGFSESATSGLLGSGMRELGSLNDQAQAIDDRIAARARERADANSTANVYRRRLDAALAEADRATAGATTGDEPGTRSGGGQTADQRARAELASQAAARTMVAQIETDLTERRIAELDRLMGAETLAATAANDNGRAEVDRLLAAEEMEQGLADKRQRRLDADAAAHESYTGRLAELNDQRVHGAQRAAEFTNGAFESMGKAIGTHVQALIDGRESVGTALQGMLSDTLISVGKEAVIQGGMELAKGAAALAGVVTAPLAPGHFAAGAAFLAVGAAAGVAGAALAPSAPAAGASAPRGGAGGMLGDRPSDSGSGGATVIQITYNAPVIGGRESTDAELGERLGRYQRAAGSRS